MASRPCPSPSSRGRWAGGRAGARTCWEWASSNHATCAQGLWPRSRLSPTPGWAHGLFSLSRGEQCGLPVGWPCCRASGSHGQPFHGRGKMWAKEVWCPLPPLPQLLRSLHPGSFKLLALLSHLSPHALPPTSLGERVWTGPCSGRARDLPGPSYFSLLSVSSALMSTHVWPELLLQAPRREPPAQSMAPSSSWQGRPG